MKKLLVLFLLVLNAKFTFADDSGYGCMVGEHWVYTAYIGAGKSPVSQWDNTEYKYFDYNAFKIPIYTGWGGNSDRNYRCGWINRYSATSYYDPTIPPYGGTVQIPAEQEYVKQGSRCIVSSTLGGQPMSTDGQSGVGEYVYYTYNKPGKCGGGNGGGNGGGDSENVPLDDYVGLLVIAMGITGFIAIRRNIFAL